MTACAALLAEAADSSWPGGKSAILIFFPMWKRITLFPWPAVRWPMGHVRRCSSCRACLKSAATRRGPAGLCRATTWLQGFNLCLVSARVAGRTELVVRRCCSYFRRRWVWRTCLLSLKPMHKGSMESFAQWRSLWERCGWWSGYGLIQWRRWSASSHCDCSFLSFPEFCWQSGREKITSEIRNQCVLMKKVIL